MLSCGSSGWNSPTLRNLVQPHRAFADRCSLGQISVWTGLQRQVLLTRLRLGVKLGRSNPRVSYKRPTYWPTATLGVRILASPKFLGPGPVRYRWSRPAWGNTHTRTHSFTHTDTEKQTLLYIQKYALVILRHSAYDSIFSKFFYWGGKHAKIV